MAIEQLSSHSKECEWRSLLSLLSPPFAQSSLPLSLQGRVIKQIRLETLQSLKNPSKLLILCTYCKLYKQRDACAV